MTNKTANLARRHPRSEAVVTESVQPFAVRFLSAIALLLLYTPIVTLGQYRVTVGGICCGLVLSLSLRQLRIHPSILITAGLMVLWPLVVFSICTLLVADLTPLISRFAASYALWLVSITLIALAFSTRRPVVASYAWHVNLLIVAVAGAQVILAAMFHSDFGYSIVQPLTGLQPDTGYFRPTLSWDTRAIGFVYEPSMCGRIISTLAIIDYYLSRRVFRNLVFLLLGLFLTKAVSSLVLAGVIGVILFGRSFRGFVTIAAAGVVLFSLQTFVFGGRPQSVDASSYRRTVGPLAVLSYSLPRYPFGIPIGANEIASERSGYLRENEERVTNGVYEFILYFGFFGAPFILALLTFAVFLLARKEAELSVAIVYLVLSTAVSGSLLSIESCLLTYFLVTACLAARRDVMRRKTVKLRQFRADAR